MLPPGEPHKGDAQERPPFEVERVARVLVDRLVAGLLAQVLRQGGEVDHGDLGGQEFVDPLDRLPIGHGECGAPGRVPADQLVEGAEERRHVQLAAHVAAGVDVPGDQRRVLAVELPEPLLVVGQGPVADAGGAGDRADGRRRGGNRAVLLLPQLLEQSPLLGAQGGEAVGDAHAGTSV